VGGEDTSVDHVNSGSCALGVVEDIVPVTLKSVGNAAQTPDQVWLLDQVIGHGFSDGGGVDDHRVAQGSHGIKFDRFNLRNQ